LGLLDAALLLHNVHVSRAMTESPPGKYDDGVVLGAEANEQFSVSSATTASSSRSSTAAPFSCSSSMHFETNNGSKRVLFAMCTGLAASDDHEDPTSGRRLSDLTVEPYKSSKKKKMFKPNRQDLIAEVYRRVRLLGLPEVRVDNKSVDALNTWLNENKIINPIDIAFLRQEELKFYNSLV
jgi:hypothetical protein